MGTSSCTEPHQRVAKNTRLILAFALASTLALAPSAEAEIAQVVSQFEIGNGLGGFTGSIDPNDGFAQNVIVLGDVDGNGIPDLAVSAEGDSLEAASAGAVWILFLDSDAMVIDQHRITALEAGVVEGLTPGSLEAAFFGRSLAAVGDLDGNGVPDLAAGTRHEPLSDGTVESAIRVLLLNSNGTVLSAAKIDDDSFGPGDDLQAASFQMVTWGAAIAGLGDLDGDGNSELAVGDLWAPAPVSGNPNGLVWILSLNDDGTLASSTTWGVVDLPTPWTPQCTGFARRVASAGDLNGDSVPDLLVYDDCRRAVVLVTLDATGMPLSNITIPGSDILSASQGRFPRSFPPMRDIDGDGTPDLQFGVTSGSSNTAFPYVLMFLNADFSMRSAVRISNDEGGLLSSIDEPVAPANLGDIDGDGLDELLLGHPPAITVLEVFFCGNGVIEGVETCDDAGESATCNGDCTAAACGDGRLNVTAGEACDNGATIDECCSPDCTIALATGVSCSDNDACTEPDTCDGAGVCVSGAPVSCTDGDACTADVCDPISGCANPEGPLDSCGIPTKAALKIRRKGAGRSKLSWKLSRTPIDVSILKSFSSGATLCLWDESSGVTQKVWSVALPGTLDGWKLLPDTYRQTRGGIAYFDSSAAVGGIKKLRMSRRTPLPPAPRRQKINVVARGSSLVLPSPFSAEEMFDQDPAIVFQVVQGSNGRCWGTTFTTIETSRNRNDRFSGKIR